MEKPPRKIKRNVEMEISDGTKKIKIVGKKCSIRKSIGTVLGIGKKNEVLACEDFEIVDSNQENGSPDDNQAPEEDHPKEHRESHGTLM